ncbi:MAG: citrate/2-methylcitrate synthase [Eubacteriaceae bacterium]|nr:citrate/2-methylcitrate synthase [Eubacteriaceae bacterium]
MFNFKKKQDHGKDDAVSIPDTYLQKKADEMIKSDEIDSALYPKYKVKRGLRNANGTGVVVGLTRIGEVTGYTADKDKNKIPVEGKLYYRGYEIQDLVDSYIKEDRFGFEEVTYLLIFGVLPTKSQLDEFKQLIASKRELPIGFARDMILTAPSRSIMNKLARSVLALYSYDENPDDTSVANVLRQSMDLIGCFPALIAYAYQAKQSFFEKESMHMHYPIPELSTAENILRMLRPTGEYIDLEAKVLDLCLILHAEHGGGNNSSFTTHLVSSSGTDTYSTIAAAVGSLKGPRHGGANIAVINMITDLKKNVKDITNEKEVDKYLLDVLHKTANDGSGLIYGVGHAIYTLSDPRAVLLKGMAKKLADAKGLQEDFILCDHIERRAPQLYAQVTGVEKPMCANVDLYSGFVYNALNIPVDIATPLFATARLSGWSAHRLEELIAGKKLMRPAYKNVQEHKDYIPIDARKEIVRDKRGLRK